MAEHGGWDLLVIGGGTAGIVGAKMAARLGARVSLVERHHTGGDCLWTGCVPSKALLAAAHAATAARTGGSPRAIGARPVDLAPVMSRVHEVIATIAKADSPEAMEAAGVSVIAGNAVFVAPDALEVDGERLRWRPTSLVMCSSTIGCAPSIGASGRRVTGLPQFTHLAGVAAGIAATNAVLGIRRRLDLAAVPRVTFTHPEVAAVGAPSWSDVGEQGRGTLRHVTQDHADVDRAVADGQRAGFTTLVLDGRRIVGGTIVGPRAGESIAEVVLAVTQRLSTADLVGAIHAYPTYSDGVWNAAIADMRQRLGSPPAQAVSRRIVGVRRAWLRRRSRGSVSLTPDRGSPARAGHRSTRR